MRRVAQNHHNGMTNERTIHHSKLTYGNVIYYSVFFLSDYPLSSLNPGSFRDVIIILETGNWRFEPPFARSLRWRGGGGDQTIKSTRV